MASECQAAVFQLLKFDDFGGVLSPASSCKNRWVSQFPLALSDFYKTGRRASRLIRSQA